MEVALTGLVVGLGAAMSFGPMALLCVRRTLIQGRSAGLMTGAGIAFGDATYAFVAAFGITVVADTLIQLEFVLSVLGASFLCLIGARAVLSSTRSPDNHPKSVKSRGPFLSAYGLTLANPMTIVFFAAVFAGISLAEGYRAGTVFVLAVFVGSMAWWLILATSVASVGASLSPNLISWLSRVSGVLIIALALGIVVRQIA